MDTGGRITLERVYVLALLVAPATFFVGALASYRSDALVEAAGFLLLAVLVGALSLHFWRDV